MNNVKIDFVIPWVDGEDPIWLNEKNIYDDQEINIHNNSKARYRDNNLLKFWFRGIEENANWVNKIHFITYGHVPNWLNLNHPKLNIVKHADYLEPKYLPTYSSITLELNLHKIKGLSENFVYFNDDCFIIDKLNPEDFFYDNLPVDEAIFRHVDCSDYLNEHPHILLNNIGFINRNIKFQDSIKKYNEKYLNNIYDKLIKDNEFYSKFSWFPGFYMLHLPQPLQKMTYHEIWKAEYTFLDEISKYKFRNAKCVNQYILRAWQLLNGKFVPSLYRKKGRAFYNIETELNEILSFINDLERPIICINDNVQISDEINESYTEIIESAFQKRFPKQCSFELE